MNQINYAYKCRKINNHQSNNRAEPHDIATIFYFRWSANSLSRVLCLLYKLILLLHKPQKQQLRFQRQLGYFKQQKYKYSGQLNLITSTCLQLPF